MEKEHDRLATLYKTFSNFYIRFQRFVHILFVRCFKRSLSVIVVVVVVAGFIVFHAVSRVSSYLVAMKILLIFVISNDSVIV